MFSVKLIGNVPLCCSHSHEAVREVRALEMFLCTPGLGLSGHTVLRKVLSDYSRSCQVLSEPHKLLELYSNCPALENLHPKEFMMQIYVPDSSEGSVEWLKSSGFARHELTGGCGSV